MLRTIWCRKALARTVNTMMSPRRSIETSCMSLMGDLAWQPDARNEEKSCVPIRCCAPSRMRSTSIGRNTQPARSASSEDGLGLLYRT
jgi:hypothetical protein